MRWTALIVLCIGNLMIILDGSIVFVALPTIQNALGFSGANLSWVVNGYLIPFAGLMLLAGRYGDLLGRRLVFLAGLTIFTLSSLLCGLSTTQGMLIVFRFLQGVGGALSSAVILGMVVNLFPEPKVQAKAIGIYSFAQAAGSSIGLIAGGLLTQGLGWYWIFFVNIPIGLIAVILTLILVPADKGLGLNKGNDLPGAFLITLGLTIGIFTIVEAPVHHWSSIFTACLVMLALANILAFVILETRVKKPLINLKLFSSAHISGANVTMFLAVAGLFGFQYFTTLYLQKILGLNPVQAGLAFIPAPFMIAVVSLKLSRWLNDRIGSTRMLPLGLALIMLGLIWLSRVPSNGSYFTNVLPAMILIGFGFGASVTILMSWAMKVDKPSELGLASGVINTTQQVGAAIGTAILSMVSTERFHSLTAKGFNETSSLIGGFHLSFVVSAGLLGISILAAITLQRRHSEQTKEA